MNKRKNVKALKNSPSRIALFFLLAIFGISLLALPGCLGRASKMAAPSGVSASSVKKCKSKDCFYSLGADVLDTKYDNDGRLVEVYRVPRRRGSTVRSFGHSLASIGTLGIWNIVAAPLEGFASDDRYTVFRATYKGSEGDEVEKVEINA